MTVVLTQCDRLAFLSVRRGFCPRCCDLKVALHDAKGTVQRSLTNMLCSLSHESRRTQWTQQIGTGHCIVDLRSVSVVWVDSGRSQWCEEVQRSVSVVKYLFLRVPCVNLIVCRVHWTALWRGRARLDWVICRQLFIWLHLHVLVRPGHAVRDHGVKWIIGSGALLHQAYVIDRHIIAQRIERDFSKVDETVKVDVFGHIGVHIEVRRPGLVACLIHYSSSLDICHCRHSSRQPRVSSQGSCRGGLSRQEDLLRPKEMSTAIIVLCSLHSETFIIDTHSLHSGIERLVST